uniref:SMODS and SLOG-associating 2TM effector domain-containing protein n=1 Tax=viral metagenome TaxID=1070528 RepID=A0A6C0IYB2_9ZZZZ
MPKKNKIASIKRNYWKQEEEILLKQWADNAKCYQWMHNKSRQIYQKKNAMYTIPVIIISTITGTANFAQDRFSEKIKEYVVITIGSLSLIAGIITTVYQFLKISEINEGHRVAMLSWGKFSRNLEAELSRHPLDRTSASELIKISKEEYNRLVEISPFITNKVLENFNKKFKNSKNLFKPEIGNIINPMNMFTMDDSARQNMIDELNQNINIKNKAIIKKETKKLSQLDKFKTSFHELNNRYPNKDEIHKNMKYINDENYSSLSETSTVDSNQSNNSLGQENYNNSDDNVNYSETHIDMSEIDNEDIINDSEEIILDDGTDLDKSINKETIAYL